ncbi:MAG: malate synthase A [Xanthomonadaceae bacterium]|nr:malate synthase A [Xanthomonadaceae bacterium]
MQNPAHVMPAFAPTVSLAAEPPPDTEFLLSDELCALLAQLAIRYRSEIGLLLDERVETQQRFNAGALPDFAAETRGLREGDWKVAPIPEGLQDRRVEITGPVERKMVINALNSGARVFMADFEDSTTPTWANLMHGQHNLYDAVRGAIEFTNPDGREYRLGPNPAVLMVRPRGLHLEERHVVVEGLPMPGALFDAAVFLFHNARELVIRGSGPYLYLPKLENENEAAVWDAVLTDIEYSLGLTPGTVKVTVLVETITAVFRMHEILHALRRRVVGLNCGRWDYIFSYIKRLRGHPDRILPDRNQVSMETPFLRAYSRLLIQTCHRRGVLAMGGMAAQIPVRGDDEANSVALARVRADKEREAGDGHDGTWVAHPGLVPVAMEIFDRVLGDAPNQVAVQRDDVHVSAADLLEPPPGTITEAGVRGNIAVAIRYLAAWLSGSGCVPINNLMEDAATAEIARAQLWQWVRSDAARLDDGRKLSRLLVRNWLLQELDAVRSAVGDDAYRDGRFRQAADLLERITADDEFVEFITLPAYKEIDDDDPGT